MATFTFRKAEGAPEFCTLRDETLRESFLKWGLGDATVVHRLSFDEPFQPYQEKEFVNALFNSDALRQVFRCGNRGRAGPLPSGLLSASSRVLGTSCTDLSLFRRLSADEVVVRNNGALVKCFEDFIDGFVVGDRLRELLLNPNSELSDLFTEAERGELLFWLLEFVALGGEINQYEDEFEPYRAAVRALYRDLVSIARFESGEPRIVSHVFAVTALATADDPGGNVLFASGSRQDRCAVCVDPLRRTVAVLYHAW